MPRLLPALLGFLAAALIVLAALLPEYEQGGVGFAQIDPERVAWVPVLVGMLVEVGLVLSGALMVALGESRKLAGGLLLGAGVLGLTLRVVRLFQIAEAPGLDAGVGSWVDALAAFFTVSAGALALSGGEDEDLYDEDYDDEDAPGEEPPPAPLPGEDEAISG
ncbi:MAG: hypothetical protein ACRDH9_02035 [Actinomycetota bacterium]